MESHYQALSTGESSPQYWESSKGEVVHVWQENRSTPRINTHAHTCNLSESDRRRVYNRLLSMHTSSIGTIAHPTKGSGRKHPEKGAGAETREGCKRWLVRANLPPELMPKQ